MQPVAELARVRVKEKLKQVYVTKNRGVATAKVSD